MGWFKRSAPQAAPTGPVITDLRDAERAWVAECLASLDGAEADIVALGTAYDEALRGWTATAPDPEHRPDPNVLINRLGVGFGEHVRLRTGMSWVVASDEYGTELALHGQPGDVLLYPANLVAKRWVAGEAGVLPELAAALIERVTHIREQR
ncbi:DUF3806 domain-containing protein [Jiangella alkaliphila]|uniref:DUF3806 domain-containing protein n=1 Tax=Jiangella alkaliphila TaxID=419479 RepID=A0A1H2FQP0_9ACTN|nr:DUF3806 domain-containing protein [Jiangella alkaliphila]SDU09680.1 protein of unknown function [Jiangella alkaliphila]